MRPTASFKKCTEKKDQLTNSEGRVAIPESVLGSKRFNLLFSLLMLATFVPTIFLHVELRLSIKKFQNPEEDVQPQIDEGGQEDQQDPVAPEPTIGEVEGSLNVESEADGLFFEMVNKSLFQVMFCMLLLACSCAFTLSKSPILKNLPAVLN